MLALAIVFLGSQQLSGMEEIKISLENNITNEKTVNFKFSNLLKPIFKFLQKFIPQTAQARVYNVSFWNAFIWGFSANAWTDNKYALIFMNAFAVWRTNVKHQSIRGNANWSQYSWYPVFQLPKMNDLSIIDFEKNNCDKKLSAPNLVLPTLGYTAGVLTGRYGMPLLIASLKKVVLRK